MTHITCRLTAKNWDQLQNPTLGNRVWLPVLFLTATVTTTTSTLHPLDDLFSRTTWVSQYQKDKTSLDLNEVSSVDARQRLRSTACDDLVIDRTCTKFGARSFAVAAPLESNRLPHHIRALQSIDAFKAALKTYLFDCS